MVKSFIVCNVEKFEIEGYIKPNQMSLFEEKISVEELVSRRPENRPPEIGEYQLELTPTNNAILTDYYEYDCKFELKKRKTGKVFGIIFHSYLEPTRFKLFYSPTNNICIIQTKTETALSFINELNSTKIFDLKPIEINFEKIMRKVDDVSGAWIADLKGKHLNSAGLFGYNVQKSPQYIEASSEGELSLIMINYENPKDSFVYSIGISKKGAIILYSNLHSFQEELEFIYKVYNDLIK